jgi:L,D-transpeptidase ErfK/SrfK
MRISHGCVRLYPENIEYLYELVAIGEAVNIVNEPFLMGRLGGEWYFEGHTPLEDDAVGPEERLELLLEKHNGETQSGFSRDETARAWLLASVANGVPGRLNAGDEDMFAHARLVRNTVATDPDAPTLSEVREMIDAAVRESYADAESM